MVFYKLFKILLLVLDVLIAIVGPELVIILGDLQVIGKERFLRLDLATSSFRPFRFTVEIEVTSDI